MNRRLALVLLTAIVWPLLGLQLTLRILPAGERFGFEWGRLSRGATPQRLSPSGSPPYETPPPRAEPRDSSFGPAPGEQSAAPTVASRRAAPTRPSRPPVGVRVSKATIRRLANSGVIPSTVPVPASGRQPAGLRFTDVSGFGIGLRNGDVLTHVAGTPAVDQGTVISVVAAAWKARRATISAEFWRAGRAHPLLVEIPYPRQRPAPAGSGQSGQ